jgi:transcriptional regulator with XRE-family HTH domain
MSNGQGYQVKARNFPHPTNKIRYYSIPIPMSQQSEQDYTSRLQVLMRSQGFVTFTALCHEAGMSPKSLRRLRRGQIAQLRLETVRRLAATLGVPLQHLLTEFSDAVGTDSSSAAELDAQLLHQEYQRLQHQLEQQREQLWQEFQQLALHTLEPWLLQWSAAAYAAQQNPQAPAVKLLPLIRPIETLLQTWGITPIGTVGEVLPYDPQSHQMVGGTAAVGESVRVRYTGYQQGDKLLHRAKVSPLT